MIRSRMQKQWIGHLVFLILSGCWAVVVLYGFFAFGWLNRLTDLTPSEFVVQASSLFFPILFLYLLGSFIDRRQIIDSETQAIKSYLEELVYPSDMGAQHMSELNANLKQQIKQIKGCFEDIFKQTNQVRTDLAGWIDDLNKIIGHMGEQTEQMASYVTQLTDASVQAKDQSADAGQNLATQADILIKVTGEVGKQLQSATKNLHNHSEEITQNVHAVAQAEKSIEQSLDKSADWVKLLSDNAHQIEKSLKSMDHIKTFLNQTDAVLLKFKEMGATLDLRLKDLKGKSTNGADGQLSAIPPANATDVAGPISATAFTAKMKQILEVLQGLSVEMMSVFDMKDEETLWAQYYAGDKAIFMRSIQKIMGQSKSKKSFQKIIKTPSFVENASSYMQQFEEMTRGLENSPWLGVLVGSDAGRLYMMLAALFKGEKNENKAS